MPIYLGDPARLEHPDFTILYVSGKFTSSHDLETRI